MRGDEVNSIPDEIDERIDRALRSYAEPGEIPEARVFLAGVMARAREAEPRRQSRRVWGWVAVAGMAAMVMLAGVVWVTGGPRRAEIAWTPRAPSVTKSIPQQPRTDGSEPPHSSLLAPAAGATRMGHPRMAPGLNWAGSKRAILKKTLPKLDVFPTPRPLSAEEGALVTFAMQAPPAVKKAVIEDQQHWDDPIIVADLQQPALKSDSHQDQ